MARATLLGRCFTCDDFQLHLLFLDDNPETRPSGHAQWPAVEAFWNHLTRKGRSADSSSSLEETICCSKWTMPSTTFGACIITIILIMTGNDAVSTRNSPSRNPPPARTPVDSHRDTNKPKPTLDRKRMAGNLEMLQRRPLGLLLRPL